MAAAADLHSSPMEAKVFLFRLIKHLIISDVLALELENNVALKSHPRIRFSYFLLIHFLYIFQLLRSSATTALA